MWSRSAPTPQHPNTLIELNDNVEDDREMDPATCRLVPEPVHRAEAWRGCRRRQHNGRVAIVAKRAESEGSRRQCGAAVSHDGPRSTTAG